MLHKHTITNHTWQFLNYAISKQANTEGIRQNAHNLNTWTNMLLAAA